MSKFKSQIILIVVTIFAGLYLLIPAVTQKAKYVMEYQNISRDSNDSLEVYGTGRVETVSGKYRVTSARVKISYFNEEGDLINSKTSEFRGKNNRISYSYNSDEVVDSVGFEVVDFRVNNEWEVIIGIIFLNIALVTAFLTFTKYRSKYE